MENLLKMTVSELTEIIRKTLEGSFFGLQIEGEISDFKVSSTGHWYFSLKDEGALISAAVWRTNIPKVGFIPKNGQKVVVTGNLSVYPPSGRYQITCSSMRLSGDGELLAKLEERKKYYESLGYFDPTKRKPIPKHPQKVAVITSPTGAALQDILQVTGRRNPKLEIIILPAPVQGNDAAPIIAKRIDEVNEYGLADVMIVGRGGGSLEDLLPFSEDCVIEAIHRSVIPVISAVGHEIDWAISDFAADLRAPTPSAAAEQVCASAQDEVQIVDKLKNELIAVISNKLKTARIQFANIPAVSFPLVMERKIANIRMKYENSVQNADKSMNDKLETYRNRFMVIKSSIAASSPIDILKRGYGIITGPDNKTVRSVKNLKVNDIISIRTSDGHAQASVTEVNNG